jgi:hypothetical protein
MILADPYQFRTGRTRGSMLPIESECVQRAILYPSPTKRTTR